MAWIAVPADFPLAVVGGMRDPETLCCNPRKTDFSRDKNIWINLSSPAPPAVPTRCAGLQDPEILGGNSTKTDFSRR
jgi:hypothetical protein